MSNGTITKSRSYIYGTDGLAGIMLGNAQNSSWSLNLVAITDHLGSIMMLMDNNGCYVQIPESIPVDNPWGVSRS